MPRVPTREQQVRDTPVPGVRLRAAPSPEALGAGVGETLKHAGSELYQRELYYADRAAVVDAETRAGQEQLRITQALRGFRGKEAAQAPEFAAKEFDSILADISKGLASDRQRQWFNELVRHNRDALDRAALNHFNVENERFLENAFAANIQQSIDTVRANIDNPVEIAYQRMDRENKIRERAERLGYNGTPQEQNEIVASNSEVHRTVIATLLNRGDDIQASRYYEKVKGKEANGYVVGNQTIQPGMQFTAKDREFIDSAMMEGSTRGEARRKAESLIAEYGMTTPDERASLLEAVRKIEDDKVADLVRTRIEHEFHSVDQLGKARAEQNFLQASKIIEENWQRSSAPVRDMIPVELWNSLTPGEQHTLEAKRERLRAPVVSHDPAVWFKFKTMKDEDLARLSPQKLMSEYLNHFDKEHYDRALNEFNAAINVKGPKEGKPPDEKFVSALTVRERIKNAFNLSGVAKDIKKLTTEEAIWFDRFEREADHALSQLPKNATPEQIDTVLSGLTDSLLKQKYTVDPGAFRFNKDVPAIGLPDVQEPRSIRIPLKDIPPDRQNVLRGALKQAGVPVTERAIEELEAKYRMKKGGQ